MPSINPKTLWEAKPHTLAKIEIVGRYLYLWFSILGAHGSNKRLVYIDGFAGPGRYTNSDRSSPVAALQAAKDAIQQSKANLQGVEFAFLFVEKQRDFADSLRNIIESEEWPPEVKWRVEHGSFEDKVGGILTNLRTSGAKLAPTFAFIDPFGATGLPFRVVAEILSYPKCEVLLNLDSDGIGRVLTAQQFEKNQAHLDALFGDQSWKDLDPSKPMATLAADVLALYKRRLRSLPDVEYVFAFAMNSREGQLNYHLVFAVDKTGSYSFSDDSFAQTMLFDFKAPAEWAVKMQSALSGSWRPYSDFQKYALNETPFINPKAMFKHLNGMGKLQVQWKGQPSKTGFPEEKINSIFIAT